MVQLVLHREYLKNHICFQLPREEGLKTALAREMLKCQKKYNDFMMVKLQPPYRPRTTGPYSQNHHLNGHIIQICNETGHSYEEIKYIIKMTAVEQFGYPYTQIMGHIVPKGEHECNTQECGLLIEAAHMIAAKFHIILIETE